MKRPSKIIPNNTPLAQAARAGEVVKVHRPTESRGAFKPWSKDQPKYERWFRDLMQSERCQCPDPSCDRIGRQVHHEEFGADKDDRAIMWMALHCHHDVRHKEAGVECWLVDGVSTVLSTWTPEQYRAGCSAVAGSNWLMYLDAMEHVA